MSSGNWYNNDGLYIEYGTTKSAVATAGEYKTYGDMREVNIRLDLTTLGTTAAIIDNNFKFPTGVRIARVDVITHTASTGAGAVFNLGFQREDRSTEIDYDGLIAALPLANVDVAGETTSLTAGATYAGALLGTALSNPGYLTADYDTAAFTAGVVDIRVFYYGYGTITQ